MSFDATTRAWTITSITNVDYPPTDARDAMYRRRRSVGKPLEIPPSVGMWIQEKQKNAHRRMIIDVRCGDRIITIGRRHSTIMWKNLDRYIEVEPWTHDWYQAAVANELKKNSP